MTMHCDAEPTVDAAQAAPALHPAGRAVSVQARPARRPVSDTAAALPADPFAGQSWLAGLSSHRLSGHRLSGRPAVFVLASLIVALLASSAAPTRCRIPAARPAR